MLISSVIPVTYNLMSEIGDSKIYNLTIELGLSMSHKTACRPVKTQTRLWSALVYKSYRYPLEDTFGSLTTHRVLCEDSDQTSRMCKLVWVFAVSRCNHVENAEPRSIIGFLCSSTIVMFLKKLLLYLSIASLCNCCCLVIV